MQKYFDKAVNVAMALDKSLFPSRNVHFAFMLYQGRFLSIATNKRSTHPINERYNPKFNKNGFNYSHKAGSCAELNCMVKMRNTTNIEFSKCTLILLRLNRLNKLNYSAPCPSCRNLLKWMGLREVWYSTLSDISAPKFEKYV